MDLITDLNFENWQKLNREKKVSISREIVRVLKNDFQFIGLTKADFRNAIEIPIFIHQYTQTNWCLIPGSEYSMGCSLKEEEAAKRIFNPPPLTFEEMRPVHTEKVEPFLILQYPIQTEFACKYIELKNESERLFPKKEEGVEVVSLSFKEAELLAEKSAFSLPTETQWEYACRGGTDTLFFFGDEIPNINILEKYVSPKMEKPNPFNLFGLFFGEWCKDLFASSYDGKPHGEMIHSVRGGGSIFWPWQDAGEWAFCVSAMRMPSSDTFTGLCAARLTCKIY